MSTGIDSTGASRAILAQGLISLTDLTSLNQAVAARLCGAEVMMVAKVGGDLFGPATINNFASFGIDTTHVHIVDGAPTGVAPIFVEPNGQNRIIVVKGANDRLAPADVDAAAADLRRVDAIILQFEVPLETV